MEGAYGGWMLLYFTRCFDHRNHRLVIRTYGQLPAVTPFVYGIKPAIIAIILVAVFPLAKKSLKSLELGVIGMIALVSTLWI